MLSVTERYRSGHNGPDSKSGIRQRIEGSNPSLSAKGKKYEPFQFVFLAFFSYCQRALNGLAGGTATKRSYFTEKRAGQTTGETVVCKPPDSECTVA